VTLGFETFLMRAGDAISYDSSTPHRLANVGNEPVEAIWFDEGGHNDQP
jgi:mannose-6-phosphate isomerase-like protein (cupin superfamily)